MKNEECAWYYAQTEGTPTPPLIEEAISLSPKRGLALDLGAGMLRDTERLLTEGYHVLAIDPNPMAAANAREFSDKRFIFVQTTAEKFKFPKGVYNMIVAYQVLNFCQPERFDAVVSDLCGALKPGGVLVAALYSANGTMKRLRPDFAYATPDRLVSLIGSCGVKPMLVREPPMDIGFPQLAHLPFYSIDLIAKKAGAEASMPG